MNTGKSGGVIVFRCDDSGKIQKVNRDDLGMEKIIRPGAMFPSAVDRDSLGKALNFMLEIRIHGSAVGWELNVLLDDSISTLHFAGFTNIPFIVIVGSLSRQDLLQFLKGRKEKDAQTVQHGAEVVSRTVNKEIADAGQSTHFDDLTRLYNEISNMHRELAKKTVELERINELKNEFLGMAAHDLRTSLWTIQMFSQFLFEEIRAEASVEQLELLKTIMEGSENLKNIVGNYLDIATIESGRLQLDLKPTDLVALCQNCVRLNGILAQRKQIQLSLTHEELPLMNLDAARMEQLVNNLINNAIKFSAPQTDIHVDLHRSEDQVIICVQDEGVGIPADRADVLFEPFESGRTQGTAEERGSGLGLAIARKVILEHGGKIWVESEVGEGSKFCVSLPLTPFNAD